MKKEKKNKNMVLRNRQSWLTENKSRETKLLSSFHRLLTLVKKGKQQM